MAAPTLDLLVQRLGASVREPVLSHGVFVLMLDRSALAGTVRQLKSEFGFDLFLDVTAVDWPQQEPRFEVVYHFYSTEASRCACGFQDARSPETASDRGLAVAAVRLRAFLMERECHDMYGIVFRGNDWDLRPILLYEGFHGASIAQGLSEAAKSSRFVRYRT